MPRSDFLNLVDKKYHRDLLRFIQTGEASPEFLSYLERDADCQKAVDTAFEAQAADFQVLVSELQRTDNLQQQQTGPSFTPRKAVNAALATAALAVLVVGGIGTWKSVTNQDRINQLTADLADTDKAASKAREDRDRSKQELASTREELKKARDLLKNKGSDNSALVDKLNKQIADIEQKLSAAGRSLGARTRELEAARQSLAAKDKEFQTKSGEVSALKAEKVALEKALAETKRSSLSVSMYWCNLMRNQPFPGKSRLADVLLPKGVAEENGYVAAVAADLRGQYHPMKNPPKVPSVGPWSTLARAEVQLQVEGNPAEFLKLLAGFEQRLMMSKEALPTDANAAVDLLTDRGTAYEAAARSLHWRRTLPPGLLSALKDDRPAYRVAAAILLAELGAEGAGAKDALAEAQADKDPYVKAAASYAIRKVVGTQTPKPDPK